MELPGPEEVEEIDQLELVEENVENYLGERLDQFPFESIKETKVREIPTGFCNVNWIFEAKIVSGNGEDWKLYLKQSRPYVKVKTDVPFFVERSYYEYKAIQILGDIIGEEVVPTVFYYDEDNYVMVMDDLQGGGEVLAKELKEGIVRPETGVNFGKYLGELHGETHGEDIVIRDREKDRKMFNFNYEFRTKGAKKILGEEPVEEIVNECKNAKKALTFTDLASKNIFVEGEEVRFYDFENVVMNDPVWDVGFLLGHFFLELGHRKGLKEKVKRLLENFMENYRTKMEEKGIERRKLEEITKRATKIIGITVLHRVAGGVGKGKGVYVSYIEDEKLQDLKDLARETVRGKYSSPLEVIV